jgi:hypothetical protein
MAVPPVSVLMTTRNGAGFIAATIDSVLAQTLGDFELILVDDGSTDDTPDILARYHDPRFHVLRNRAPAGIAGARNIGFAAARAPYIAALDHDDLMLPERLALQAAYLDAQPGVVLVGTEVRLLRDGRLRAPHHAAEGDALALRWQLLTDNPLTWSSVMFRAGAVRALGTFMRPEYEPSDDFDLYHRLLGVGDIARLDEVLTTYRYHGANASLARAAALDAAAARVLAGAYAPWLGDDAQVAAEAVVRHLSDRQPIADAATLGRLGAWLERLLAGFDARHRLSGADAERIARLAGETWWQAVRAAIRSGHPDFARLHGTARTLAGACPAPALDLLVSRAVGIARRLIS